MLKLTALFVVLVALLGNLLTPLAASGATLTVQNPCAPTPWLVESRRATVGLSVGRVTIDALTEQGLPFVGSDAGINSIQGTVTGDAAMEVVSDTEMRAYGWCYHVNGVEPGLYPHEVMIQSESDEVTWFFGYAHYKDGWWIAMCVPTYLERPRHVCGQ